MGRWREAIRQLDAFERLTGSMDQYPVVADCYRALGDHDEVEERWDQLRRASPSAGLVAEGRLVAAGSLADRGDLGAAIRLLGRSRSPRHPKLHHLRQWYALADLHERAGDLPEARELFARVAKEDRDLGDAAERLAALG
jgi:tetratricopeptide (TPR) repeat protein